MFDFTYAELPPDVKEQRAYALSLDARKALTMAEITLIEAVTQALA